jgi:hypothetical protein
MSHQYRIAVYFFTIKSGKTDQAIKMVRQSAITA